MHDDFNGRQQVGRRLVLHEVTGDAELQSLRGGELIAERRHDQDARLRARPVQHPRQLEPTAVFEGEVQKDQMGCRSLQQRPAGPDAGRDTDDLQLGPAAEHRRQGVPYDQLIFDDQDPRDGWAHSAPDSPFPLGITKRVEHLPAPGTSAPPPDRASATLEYGWGRARGSVLFARRDGQVVLHAADADGAAGDRQDLFQRLLIGDRTGQRDHAIVG